MRQPSKMGLGFGCSHRAALCWTVLVAGLTLAPELGYSQTGLGNSSPPPIAGGSVVPVQALLPSQASPSARNGTSLQSDDADYYSEPVEERVANPRIKFTQWDLHYPAVYGKKLDSKSPRASQLLLLFKKSKYVQKMVGIGESWLVESLKRPREWLELAIPDGIAQYLPGATVYLTMGIEHQDYLLARRDTVAYILPHEMNLLLRDCGMEFREKDVPKWTRVLTCFLRGAREYGLSLGEGWSGLQGQTKEYRQKREAIKKGERPFFPEFVIESIGVDTTSNWSGFPEEVRVKYRVRSFRGEIVYLTTETRGHPGFQPRRIFYDTPGYHELDESRAAPEQDNNRGYTISTGSLGDNGDAGAVE